MIKFLKKILIIIFIAYSNLSFAKDVSISKQLWNIDLNDKDKKTIKNIFKYIEAEEYGKSLKLSSKFHNSLFHDAFKSIINYKRISDLDLEKILIFSKNNFFFDQDIINERIEEIIITKNLDYLNIKEKYPDYYQSKNKFFQIYLIKEKSKFYQNNEDWQNKEYFINTDIKNRVSEIWINNEFTNSEQNDFFQQYQSFLTEGHHISKIRKLFLEDKYSEAKKIFDLISEDYEKLFRGIIKITKNPKNLKKILLSIPRKYRSDELLSYYKAKWLMLNKKNDEVIDLLLDISNATTSYENHWWKLRKLYGRELLKDQKYISYKKAYKIISNHNIKKGGSTYADAEWTSGWIALRFLNNSKEAYQHFTNLYKNVKYPISISRATYWLAEAALNDNENKALYWYQIAMQYPTYFYGQIAYSKYKKLKQYETYIDISLPEDPTFNEDNIKSLKNNKMLKTALLFAINDEIENSQHILQYLINDINDKGNVALIIELLKQINNKKLLTNILKSLAEQNIFFIKKQFKFVKEIKDENSILIHALIKQESGFSQSATSSAGALGFMQLMPHTAKEVARKMNIEYNDRRLQKDFKYNIKLGSYYINYLLKRFDNSKIMAIASYNAGPNAVKRWVNDFYDPREKQDIDDIIDWIELITYSETRNYVQRIMENLIIYQYLFFNKSYNEITIKP